MGRHLSLVRDGEPPGSIVCTWCALRFRTQAELTQHRLDTPACRVNAGVSSPLQSRYHDADLVPTRPGQYVLHKVRAPTCLHTADRSRVADEFDNTLGWQCNYCYSLLESDHATSD